MIIRVRASTRTDLGDFIISGSIKAKYDPDMESKAIAGILLTHLPLNTARMLAHELKKYFTLQDTNEENEHMSQLIAAAYELEVK